jgi:catechol 2,3-dioxygenase-like lactoylglutathione lyase family enzyme
MIRVRKIAHAGYEMPDLDKQAEYYTNILGLTLAAKDKDAIFLANTVDHHSVVLRKGAAAQCTRVGFQIGPNDDLNEFEKQTQGQGVKTSRKKDPEPSISDMLTFEDPKGTTIEVFKRDDFSHQKFGGKGVVPHKLGHVAFHCADVKAVAKFYVDVLGFRESDWMADFFVFLRCGPDHHTINLMGTGANRHFHTAFEVRNWGQLQEACDFLSTATRRCGGPADTASDTISSPITAARTG